MKFVRIVITLFLLYRTIHSFSKNALKQNSKEYLRKYSNGAFKPIRLRYIWANQTLGNTLNNYTQSQYDKLYNLYLNDLVNFFPKFLSVYPYDSNVNHVNTTSSSGCKVGSAAILSNQIEKDLVGYDYVFYVNPAPIVDNPNATASAKHCAFSTFGSSPSYVRPVAGLINVQPSWYRIDDDTLTQFDIISRKKTMIHETTHALAFHTDLIKRYIDDEGNVRKNDSLLMNFTLADGKTVSPFLIDDRMKSVVSDYYNCSTPNGFPLHINMAHFNLQPLRPGIMKPSDNGQSRISIFLLTIYDVTGWYIVNKDQVLDDNIWGKGKGCRFINTLACDDENGQRYSEYCPNSMIDNGTFTCDYHYDSRGPCRLATVDNYTTVCPSIIPSSTLNCFDPANAATKKRAWEFFGTQGDTIGKCFATDASSYCFRSKCDQNAKSITVFLEDKNYTSTYTSGVRSPDYLIHKASDGTSNKYYFPVSWERFCFTYYNPDKVVNRKRMFRSDQKMK